MAFAVGDRVRCISVIDNPLYGTLNEEYVVTEVSMHGQKQALRLEGMDGRVFANRFELVDDKEPFEFWVIIWEDYGRRIVNSYTDQENYRADSRYLETRPHTVILAKKKIKTRI